VVLFFDARPFIKIGKGKSVMKHALGILLFSLIIPLLTGCGGEGIYSGTLILEGHHEIHAGETLRGDLLMLGGQTLLAEGSRVTGSIYMVDGEFDANGKIEGDISLLGGTLFLGPQTMVSGDLDIGGGILNQASEAVIRGNLNTESGLKLPAIPSSTDQALAGRLIRSALNAILVAALAYLLARFAPRPVARVTEAVMGHPVVSGAMGVLTGIVGLSLLVLMAFTIILIPVTLLGILLMGAAVVYGWIGWGMAVGHRLSQWRGWMLQRPGQAVVGTLTFMLAVELIGLMPFAGGIIGILTAAVGLGAVLLTRFGMRNFVPATDVA
jgi:hypothetical protein